MHGMILFSVSQSLVSFFFVCVFWGVAILAHLHATWICCAACVTLPWWWHGTIWNKLGYFIWWFATIIHSLCLLGRSHCSLYTCSTVFSFATPTLLHSLCLLAPSTGSLTCLLLYLTVQKQVFMLKTRFTKTIEILVVSRNTSCALTWGHSPSNSLIFLRKSSNSRKSSRAASGMASASRRWKWTEAVVVGGASWLVSGDSDDAVRPSMLSASSYAEAEGPKVDRSYRMYIIVQYTQRLFSAFWKWNHAWWITLIHYAMFMPMRLKLSYCLYSKSH